MAEYYIRRPDSEEVRGPFDLDKIITLADAGKIDRDTLYYDEAKQDWIPLDSSEELRGAIFSEKRQFKLQSKPKQADFGVIPSEPSIALEDSLRAEVKVDKMLAAAEGAGIEADAARREARVDHVTLGLSPHLLGGLFLASGFVLAWKDLGSLADAWEKRDLMPLVRTPVVIIGVIDFIFATLLFMAVSEVYPAVRLRAALGLGLLGYLAWNARDPAWFFATVIVSAATFAITLSPRARYTIPAALAGAGAYVWMCVEKFMR